jgi:hypothetical protein
VNSTVLKSTNEAPVGVERGGDAVFFGRGGRTRTLACRNQNPMP